MHSRCRCNQARHHALCKILQLTRPQVSCECILSSANQRPKSTHQSNYTTDKDGRIVCRSLPKTRGADTFGTDCGVRSTGKGRLFAQGEVFKHDLTGKMNGTGQNRSLKRGVRPARVFVRRGSTVYALLLSAFRSHKIFL